MAPALRRGIGFPEFFSPPTQDNIRLNLITKS